MAFDLANDGSIIFTTGGGVSRLTPAGEQTQLCTGHLIEHVIATG